MRKYKEDEAYLDYIRANAGKVTSKEMMAELDISIQKLRELAFKNNISLRVSGNKKISPRDKHYFQVKKDPFSGCKSSNQVSPE
jgi:hypothetical protein